MSIKIKNRDNKNIQEMKINIFNSKCMNIMNRINKI